MGALATMPFGVLQGGFVLALSLCWLIDPDWKGKWTAVRSSKWLWMMAAFYGVYLLSLFWTANLEQGRFNVQVKLGMLVYPLVFSGLQLSTRETRHVLTVFLVGLSAAGLFMLIRAGIIWFTEHRNAFYYQDFSDRLIHPSYLAMYYCTGILLLFHGILLQAIPARPWKITAAIICFFFVIIILLLASKMGILALVLLIISYAIYAILRFRRYVVGLVAIATLFLGAWFALKLFPGLSERIQNLTSTFTTATPIDPAEVESNRVRLLIWQAGGSVAASNPFGVGAGDVQLVLENEYNRRSMAGALEKHLNAHSQFLQTFLATGWIGIIALLCIVLLPILWSIRRQYGFAILFFSLFLLNCLPESMLEVQAGTLFFGLFYSLFLQSADRRCLTPLKAPPLAWPL
jgi:O-antigen ligase